MKHPSNSEHLTHPKYRKDIDGLRAIAVLSVVVFHAFPNVLRGGFIGVDIFFVISGFLISTIIFSSLQKNSFTFIEFYSRRIKRIFPALILVLSASYLFGWFALLADEYAQLGKHIAGGAGFVSNFVFLKESGYFDNAADTKPLLHLWSLGVEEQFYILWPLLLWLAWKQRFNFLSISILVAVISFGLNIARVHGHTVDAFYSPQTRFWELLAGSVLAYITLHQQNIFPDFKHKLDLCLGSIIYAQAPETHDRTLSNVQSIFGGFLILIGVFVITKQHAFPGWWAMLPVFGAVLIISAGMRAWLNRNVLSSRVLVWFGLISFPLYLWHWPLLSFARIMESETPSAPIRMAAVAISILLAWLTYWLIEKPIRFGQHGNFKTIALLVLMIAVGCVGYNSFQHNGFTFRHKQLHKSNTQFTWPEYMNHKADCVSKFGPEHWQYCLIDDIDKQPEILLIGDSNANHLFPGLNRVTKGKNLLNLGRGGCLPFLGVSSRIAEGEQHCEKVMANVYNFATTTQSVRTIVLSMMGAGYINKKRSFGGGFIELHFLDDLNQTDPAVIFESGMRKTLQLLMSSNKKVIFVVSTPRMDFSPTTCVDIRPLRLTSKSIKSPCGISRVNFEKDNQVYRDLVFRVLKDFPNVKIFDAASELCDKHYCWAMKEDKMLYRDEVHLSVQGSEYLAQKLVKAIPSVAE